MLSCAAGCPCWKGTKTEELTLDISAIQAGTEVYGQLVMNVFEYVL